MGKLDISISSVLLANGPLPTSYTISVKIRNSSRHPVKEISVQENLLTYTNVYFSTVSLNSVATSFSRNLLIPDLICISVIEPGQEVLITYPVSLYSQVGTPTTFTSLITATGKCGENGSSSLLITTLPAAPLPTPSLGIVGGGLAGLTVAYRLSQAGYNPILYEGSNRLGGRCYSGKFTDGEVYEHGGELIDTDHTDILSLISELGLTIDNLRSAELPRSQDYYQVIDYDAEPPRYVKYTEHEAAYDYYNIFNPTTGLTIFQQITNDANNTYPTNDPPSGPATPWPLTYADPVLAKKLDSMTVNDYLNLITSFLRPDGNGAKTKLAQFLKVAYVIEFGAEPCEQSSLNLIYLLGFQTLPVGVVPPNIPVDFFYPFGLSDETYHTTGGNSRIVEGLLEQLQLAQVSIFMNSRLTKIARLPDTTYQISINGAPVPPFQHLTLAIPFTVFNSNPQFNWAIDISEAQFSDLKKYAISHLAMSRNCKLNVQFKNRFWRTLGNNGSTFATSNPYLCDPCGGDIPCPGDQNVEVPCPCSKVPLYQVSEQKFQNTWEVSRAQPQSRGILVDYTGGKYSERFRTAADITDSRERNNYLREATTDFLCQLDFLLPGATNPVNFDFEYVNGNIVNVDSNNWKESPWQRGAYSFWQPGQYIAGTGTLVDGQAVPPCSIVPFAGYEGVPEPYNADQTGNCHFAGEQTAYDNQGYLNGAVESGNRVANEILNELT